MTLKDFMNEAISPWMRNEGPDSDIVLSSRIRLARNLLKIPFPIIAAQDELERIQEFLQKEYEHESFENHKDFQYIPINHLTSIEKLTLVEKHLISPHLVKNKLTAGVLISRDEQVSIMINEEDHLRIQLYFPGFQLEKALDEAFKDRKSVV